LAWADAEMLGHADIKTTMRYAHALVDDVAEAMTACHRRSRTALRRPLQIILMAASFISPRRERRSTGSVRPSAPV